MQQLDRVAYDLANEANPLPPAEDLLIVGIDERSLQEIGRWPWPRERHVQLLYALRDAGVRAVGLDVVFDLPDNEYPEVDQLLAEAIREQGKVVLPVFVAQLAGGGLLDVQPLGPLREAAAGLGHVHVEVDSDGIVRTVYLKEGQGKARWPHFAVALARAVGIPLGELPGVSDPALQGREFPGEIIRSHQNLIPFTGPRGSIDSVSFVDVVEGRVAPERLRDKIVLVGETAAGQLDNISTSLGQTSGVELNAQIFHALRTGKLAQPVSAWVAALATAGFVFLTVALFTQLSPGLLVLALLASAVLMPVLSWLLLRMGGLWLSPVPVVAALFIAYPVWNWLRLDAAMGFVRRQLRTLREDNSAFHIEDSAQSVASGADWLLRLGLIRDWELSEPLPAAADGPAIWRHTKYESQRIFNLKEGVRELRVHWPGPESRDFDLLNRVFPETPVRAERLPLGADLVDIDLAQLDTAYREARHSRGLVSGALEHLTSGVIVAEARGQPRIVNEKARQLLQVDAPKGNVAEILEGVRLPDELTVEKLLRKLLQRGRPFDVEAHSSRGSRDLLLRGRRIDLDYPMLLIAITDVTELKASEKARTEALNFLSHDLRAPLTSVLALTESARGENPDDPKLGKLLDQIERYINNNLWYAENYIHMARLQHGESMAKDECEAQSLLDNAVSQLYHSASKRDVAIEMKSCEEEVWLLCARSMVERAVMNLLDNALKHSPPGSTVTLSLECEGKAALIEVEDQGAGIPKNELEQVFAAFSQGSTAQGGVGLGLRFVAEVARNHGGLVEVVSPPGKGARFSLKIPRVR